LIVEALLSDPVSRAETLGLAVWDFIADRAHKNEAEREGLHDAANALLFDDAARKSDAPIVMQGRRLAHAVLAWGFGDWSPEGFKRLERASRTFEEFRIS
jgi:hypothetical protein